MDTALHIEGLFSNAQPRRELGRLSPLLGQATKSIVRDTGLRKAGYYTAARLPQVKHCIYHVVRASRVKVRNVRPKPCFSRRESQGISRAHWFGSGRLKSNPATPA